jgi:TonB family protein
MDIGPPFDFYEILQVTGADGETQIDALLVTPPGNRCSQPSSIEAKKTVLHQSIDSLLNEKNPCLISDRSARKEQKRCKRCLTFSGENISLGLTCGANKRLIRMDILDRDLFDPSAKTPAHTSWTMDILSKIDKALGPGVWDRPIFSTTPQVLPSVVDFPILAQLQSGEFDPLFKSEKKLSEYYMEAQTVHFPPFVAMVKAAPTLPVNVALPLYPPIARAAHVEGDATVVFTIQPDGLPTDLSLTTGSKLFESVIKDTISKVRFAQSDARKQGEITFRFSLNCNAP